MPIVVNNIWKVYCTGPSRIFSQFVTENEIANASFLMPASLITYSS